jgi:hypothetical protein
MKAYCSNNIAERVLTPYLEKRVKEH